MGTGETYLYNDCLYYSAIFPVKYDYQDCYVSKKNKKKNKVYPLSVKNKKDKIFVPKEQMRKNVHVSHWKPDEEGKYNIIDNRKMGLLSDLPMYRKVMKNIFQNVRGMSLLYKDMIQSSLKEMKLSAEETAQGLSIMGLMKSNPQAALEAFFF